MSTKSIRLHVEMPSNHSAVAELYIPLPAGWESMSDDEKDAYASECLTDFVADAAPSGWSESDMEPES